MSTDNKKDEVIGLAIKAVMTIIAAMAIITVEAGRRRLRNYIQKKRQKKVDDGWLREAQCNSPVESNYLKFGVVPDFELPSDKYTTIPLSEAEEMEWKSLFSLLGGETIRGGLTAYSFDGLLKCDLTVSELCRVKDNPSLMRGYSVEYGRISKQAKFEKVEFSSIAPLMIYQCIAVITSQYYLQVITERLRVIDKKLDEIFNFLLADDKAALHVAYVRLLELNLKTSFDIADKEIVSVFSNSVEKAKVKYKSLLANIKNFNIESKNKDIEEAKSKITRLKDSHYLDYLQMVMLSEVLSYIANVVSLKMAKSMNATEDVKNFMKRLNLDYWKNYQNQFARLRYDVITYLELSAKDSWFESKKIQRLKEEQEAVFEKLEVSLIEIQNSLDQRIVQYLKIDKDGSIKKYMMIS